VFALSISASATDLLLLPGKVVLLYLFLLL